MITTKAIGGVPEKPKQLKKVKSPRIAHVSIWVSKMQPAVGFFSMLGWQMINNRNPIWRTGQARFMRHPRGGVYLQLTEERLQKSGGTGTATHVAFECDVAATLHAIENFCTNHDLGLFIEDVGDGKKMITIPGLFICVAFEFVPETNK